MTDNFKVGIDIGSTTIKVVVLDAEEHIVYKHYARHFSDIPTALVTNLTALKDHYLGWLTKDGLSWPRSLAVLLRQDKPPPSFKPWRVSPDWWNWMRLKSDFPPWSSTRTASMELARTGGR